MKNNVWKQFNQSPLSHSAAHYLMAIHKLEKKESGARLTDIAEHLHIAPASASQSLKTLVNKELITESDGKLYQLTDQGRQQIQIVEKNKELCLRFFKDILKVSDKQADEDSCKIEHLISTETSEKLEFFLKTQN